MLTPQELRNIPEDVVSIFEECEDEILRLIGERIRAVGYLNTVSLWQLIKRKESLLFKRNVTRTLSKYTGLSQRQIRRIFKKAGAKALMHDDTFLKAITTKDTRKRNRALDKILKEAYEHTNGTLHNWTGTTANNATNHFVHAMDKAALQVQSGAFSYDEAIRRATRDLADHMDYVTYESGHKDTLEVASRRAVRTGVNQMASKLTLERCKQVGTEFVETTAHVGARETDSEDCTNHSWWQGKVFHLSEEGAVGEDGKFYPGFFSYDQAGYGYGAGICGWNCRHSFHPFIPGVSEPIYTPEELAKLNEKNIEYQGQKYSRYEIDQKQRGLERQVRKYKRREILAESVGDEQEVMRNKAFVRKYQDELDKFTKETGNRRDYERERETVGKVKPGTNTFEYVPKHKKRIKTQDPQKESNQQIVANEVKNEKILKKVTDDWYDKHLISVKEEYLEKATPGVGNYSCDDGYDAKDENERHNVTVAEWIIKIFGGDIHLMKDRHEDEIRWPDAFWNFEYWEIKHSKVGTLSSIRGRLRSADGQLKSASNYGVSKGTILDVDPDVFDMDIIKKGIRKQSSDSKFDEMDIILKSGEELIDVLRYLP